MNLRAIPALTLLCLASLTALAQQAQQTSGTFILHKFAKAIGKEAYTLDRTPERLLLTSDFLFTDRGSKVPLKTTFTAAPDLTPLSLALVGRSSRNSELNDTFTLASGTLTLSRQGQTSTSPAPPNSFLIDGYSPVAMQQMLLNFWLSHGRPASIPTPPTGSVTIRPAGNLTIIAEGKPVHLTAYTVSGLIWGVESLWLDDQNQLAALVSTDAEFDHFEAIREPYESSLATFIAAAAKDDLAALATLTAGARQPPAKRLLITNVTLIDATGAAPLKNASVFIEDGVIVRITQNARPDPRNTTILDGTGKFLIPGLWDMHAHYEQVEWGPIYLASGITTVRDLGNEFDFITTVRDTLRAGKGIGPQILMAGVVDGSGPRSLGAILADTPEEAIAVVHRYHDAGALQIKIYSSVKPALVPVITAEAHRLGMTVTGHVPTGMTTAQAVEAGMDQINHIQYPASDLQSFTATPSNPNHPVAKTDFSSPADQKKLALFQQHKTVFDPTLSLMEWLTHTRSRPVASFEPGVTHIAPQLVEALNSPGIPEGSADRAADRATAYFNSFLNTTRALHQAGLRIVAGTDQNIPGYSLHRELELYVQAGFTPLEALQSATSVPAEVMGLTSTTGTIAIGKRADLLLLDADPLADIANTRRIYRTIAAGAIYTPAPLWQSVDFKP